MRALLHVVKLSRQLWPSNNKFYSDWLQNNLSLILIFLSPTWFHAFRVKSQNNEEASCHIELSFFWSLKLIFIPYKMGVQGYCKQLHDTWIFPDFYKQTYLFPMKKKKANISAYVAPAASLHLHCASSCVFLRGQCHDQLSILSVTVAGSPSGMSRR